MGNLAWAVQFKAENDVHKTVYLPRGCEYAFAHEPEHPPIELSPEALAIFPDLADGERS